MPAPDSVPNPRPETDEPGPACASDALSPPAAEPAPGAPSDPTCDAPCQQRRRRRRRRWGRWLLLFLVLVGLAGWLARAALVARVERALMARLASQGIYLRYSARTFSLWHSLRLENVVLRRADQDNRPVVEISEVVVGVPWRAAFQSRDWISIWRVRDATLTLHDDAGAVAFQHVTIRCLAHSGQLTIERLDAQHGLLALALSGRVDLPAPKPRPASGEAVAAAVGPFLLDLSAVRGTLAVLDFPPDSKPFTIRGVGSVDLRDPQAGAVWQTDLSGTGRDVKWQGMAFRQADVRGRVSSSAGLDLTATLQLAAGSAQVKVNRPDWNDGTALALSGSLTDAAGATDEFAATHGGAAQALVISRLEGKADLLAFARNFPVLTPLLPTTVRLQKFPDHAVRDFVWSWKAPGSSWKVGSVEVRSPAALTILFGKEPLQLDLREGRFSYAANTWKAKGKVGALAWRDFRARGGSFDTTLTTGGRLKSAVTVQLPSGSADLTLNSDDLDKAPLEVSGTLADAQGQTDRFAATYRMSTGAWQVARLDGKANLFEFLGNFPGIPARLPEMIQLRGAFPEIAVRELAGRPGSPATFTSLRLVSPADVSLLLDGRAVPIDRLTGQIGSDGKRWKLTRLSGRVFGGQVSLDGTFDDTATLRDATLNATGVQMAQLKTWMGEAGATFDQAVLALDYRGSYSAADPTQITGSGHLHVENAPIVKIPLLDQTYAIFSALASPLERRGNGSLDTTFSAQKGLVTISEFTARSEAARVTATGTIDLRKREVDGRARANIRGIFGLATTPLSRVLEMKVSGPLDDPRVRPLGLDGVLTGPTEVLPDAAKKVAKPVTDIVKEGISLPFRILTPGKKPPPAEKKP